MLSDCWLLLRLGFEVLVCCCALGLGWSGRLTAWVACVVLVVCFVLDLLLVGCWVLYGSGSSWRLLICCYYLLCSWYL